jgi:hypothetical protein
LQPGGNLDFSPSFPALLQEIPMKILRLYACGASVFASMLTFSPVACAAESTTAQTDSTMIASAMTAAPESVAKNATIVVMQADGSMRQLRQGHGPFTCMPDNPATPGPDPMCMDVNAMAWVHAWVSHETPPAGKTGFMYMLAGATDASNTDPYATAPASDKHWIETGPHIMIVGAEPGFLAAYPKNADPDTSAPYVMWADTPYQHLMVPVR